jgi:uncharacterized protein (TIGR00251 family)
MSSEWCCLVAGGLRLAVQLAPNASKSEVMGVINGALKIWLQARPIDGKANEALIQYIADLLGVSRSAVVITHGHASKRKMLVISKRDLSVDQVQKAILPLTAR